MDFSGQGEFKENSKPRVGLSIVSDNIYGNWFLKHDLQANV